MRIGTCVILTKNHPGSNIVFLLLNRNTNHWELPGGKIDEGESVVAAAVRELYEETHVVIPPNDLAFVGYVEHKSRPTYPDEHWLNMIFHADGLFHSAAEAVEDIHSDGQWFRMDRLPTNTWDVVANCLLQLKNSTKFSDFS